MNPAAAAPPPAALHPLLQRLSAECGFPRLCADECERFIAAPGDGLLFFSEEPSRVKEVLDLAVILPEIVKAMPGRFRVGVLAPEVARPAASRFGLRRWPALIAVRGGRHLGSIEGLRDWTDYLTELETLFAADAGHPPEAS